MAEPPKKRSQSAQDDHAADVERTRDCEFWFEDGNVILVAQDVEFRIYKGPLMKYSPVFKDMFSLPQLASDGQTALPLIQVSDHPVDLRRLLGGFIFGQELQYGIAKEGGLIQSCSTKFDRSITVHPSLGLISSIIRMGHKYEIDAAVKAGTLYLRAQYPSHYADWRVHRCGAPNFNAVESIGVVNLAQLTDNLDILPAAFLQLCRLKPDEIINGFTRDDGVVEKLSPDDLIRLLVTRAELIKIDARNCIYILRGVSASCEDNVDCDNQTEESLRVTTEGNEYCRTFSADWSESWVNYVEDAGLAPCPACIEDMRGREEEVREDVWKTLPKVFGIE